MNVFVNSSLGLGNRNVLRDDHTLVEILAMISFRRAYYALAIICRLVRWKVDLLFLGKILSSISAGLQLVNIDRIAPITLKTVTFHSSLNSHISIVHSQYLSPVLVVG